ncbi:hypothetical protein AA21952_1456 [Acetobacter oeni LMG 21952]|nr:hypothetical protein AA21952_1456 [Acetobacter oeni LMG 21952]
MNYRGYSARIEYSSEESIFLGRVIGIDDNITFESDTVSGLKSAFEQAIDSYISSFEESGKNSQKQYSGKVMFRISPDIHAQASIAAELQKISLNQWVENTLSDSSKAEIRSKQISTAKNKKKNYSLLMDNSEDLYVSYAYTGFSYGQAFNALYNKMINAQSSQARDKYILPVCFALGHSLECHLKSFLVHNKVDIRDFGHDIKRLHNKSIDLGLYIVSEELREHFHESAWNEEQKSFDKTRDGISEIIQSIVVVHHSEHSYADRYLNYNTKTGYPILNSKVQKILVDFELTLRAKMPYPRVLWSDKVREPILD